LLVAISAKFAEGADIAGFSDPDGRSLGTVYLHRHWPAVHASSDGMPPQAIRTKARARSMKLQTMLLLIAAACLAAMPSPGLARELGPILSELASWQDGSLRGDLAVENPALLNPAEDIHCDNGCCGYCQSCCKTRDIWASAEFLMWWGKGTRLPALITTSPPGTPQLQAGVIGQPDTTILYGNLMSGDDMRTGARINFGIWLDPEHNVTLGGKFYGLESERQAFFTSSTGDPILARPFFNAVLGQQDALLIAFPGLVEGAISVDHVTDNFMGAESYIQIMMDRECCRRVDLILGYHFLRMDDSLTINSLHRITEIGGLLPQGTTFNLTDQFSTENEFHGGEIGLKTKMARGCWSLDGLIKASLGNQRQQVTITGTGEINIPPGPPAPLNGGFLALPTNSGTFERNRFVVIPEATLNLTYHHTPTLSFHTGYNIIWMSEAVTSGDQIDLRLNLSQQAGPLVGPAFPQFPFQERDFWVQGINFGMNLDF
jgi:hypothetical protein